MSYFFPIAASTHAVKVDLLFLFLGLVSGFVTLFVAAAITIFVIRYRRRPGTRGPQPSKKATLIIEISWIAISLGISLVMFFWAGKLYVEGATAPPNSEDIFVVGKQWMWKIEHMTGAREIDELHVPLGRPIRLIMTSQDVIHSFYVPEFRVKMDVLPGRYTYLWFNATKPGTYHLFCAEFCGMQHSEMRGRVIVMQPSDYQEWLAQQSPAISPKVAGAALFDKYGCSSCHQTDNAKRAPILENVYGSNVILRSGKAVFADEEYLRESIIDPNAKVVAGYTPIMPSYKDSLTPEEVLQLVAYLKSMGADEHRRTEEGSLNETP